MVVRLSHDRRIQQQRERLAELPQYHHRVRLRTLSRFRPRGHASGPLVSLRTPATTFWHPTRTGSEDSPRSVIIEQPFWKNTHVTLGFKASYLRYFYQSWFTYRNVQPVSVRSRTLRRVHPVRATDPHTARSCRFSSPACTQDDGIVDAVRSIVRSPCRDDAPRQPVTRHALEGVYAVTDARKDLRRVSSSSAGATLPTARIPRTTFPCSQGVKYRTSSCRAGGRTPPFTSPGTGGR